MKDIADKSDNTAGAAGQLPAAEYNDHKNEIQAAVEATGQVLDIGKSPNQFPRALFINGVAAATVQDSGAGPDQIILTPITGSTGLRMADGYAQLHGAVFEFYKSTPNTSQTITVNIGQSGGSLGAKNLLSRSGAQLSVGEVFGLTRIRWNNTDDRWELVETTIPQAYYPVGSPFIQFPGFPSPGSLGIPGVWTAQFETEGIFFRTPGGNASAFESGIQEDAMQQITGEYQSGSVIGGITRSGVFSVNSTNQSQGVNAGTLPNFDMRFDNANSLLPNPAKTDPNETRPRNRTWRIWIRTA